MKITFSTFTHLLGSKLHVLLRRSRDVIRWLPLRFHRLRKHIIEGLGRFTHSISSSFHINLSKIGYWWIECSVLIMSIFGIAEAYETLADFVKFNTRPLNDWERKLAYSIYGNKINYDRVRVDNLSIIGPRKYKICYVSFYTVNSWGDMQNHILIHELMHVWQYQQMGAVYIPRALAAQNSKRGYDYGGLKALQTAAESGEFFNAFNLEQQAEIVMDYYLLREGYRAHRAPDASKFNLPLYERFIDKL